MAYEIATAYVSIVPETSKIAPGVSKALTGVEKTADKTGQSMGGKISTAMGGVLKKSAVGVGAAAGAALGAGLTKGIGRLNSIEQAEAKLKGLGHSAQSVGGIMENSLAAVKGTAFGLEEAATTAAGVVAAGIKPGKELEQVLKTVGDTATIAGTSMSDMGTIFGSVAARGKLQGDDMLQLLSRGVPVLQLLADETGKTSAEISDMVSKGQIDFATFERAMRNGMGGAALEAGNTVQGAMRNMGAAAGRLGATIAGPFFKRAAGGFNGVTDALDALDARMKPVMERVDQWLTGTAGPAFERFGQSAREAFQAFQSTGVLDRTLDVFVSLGQTAGELVPSLGRIAGALGQASAAVGVGTWQIFLTALEAVGAAASALAGPLETVADFMGDHPALVTAAVGAWAAFKTIPSIVKPTTDAVKKHIGGLKDLRAGVSDIQAYYRSSGEEIGKFSAAMQLAGTSSNKTLQAMGQGYSRGAAGLQKVAAAHRQAAAAAKLNALLTKDAFTSIDYMGQQAGHSFVAATASMGAAAKGMVSGGLNVLKNGAKSVIGMFGGPWGLAFAGATVAVTACMQGLDQMGRVIEEQKNLVSNAAGAYDAMFDAIVEGGDRVEVAKNAVDSMTNSMQTMADNGPNWFHRGLLAIEEHTYGVVGLETEYMKAGKAVRHASDSAREASQTMQDLGITNEQLAQAAVGSSVAYEDMHAKLMASGRGGEFLAGELERLRTKFMESQAAAEAMGPAGARFSQVLDDISAKAGTAEDRASALRIALMELAGIKMSAAEAGAELTNTLDQVANQMTNFEGATVKANGQLDVTTKAGADAHNALMDIGDAMQRSVASGNDVNEVWSQSAGQLEALKGQLGLTEEQYQALLEAYGLTPEKLTTVAEVQADAAKAALVGLDQQIKNLEDGQNTVTMKLEDSAARKQLEGMGFKLKQLDDSGTVEIDVQDMAARQKLDGVVSEIGKISNARPTAVAQLDASGLFATNEFAAAQLATLDLKRPTPLASMDISQLDAKQVEALQKVGLLDGQTPTPDAFMNIDQLSADQQVALAKVFDLDSQRPTPLSSLDNAQLDAKAEAATGRLKKLHDTKTEPKVSANTAQALEKIGGVKNLLSSLTDKVVNIFVRRRDDGHAAGGRFARGGKLPAYARGDRHDGYRLPNSGPGSNGTDKWLAVDQYNQPVARLDHGEWIINRRSSARYDKELAAINAGTFPKLPGYATGGRTPDDFLRFARGEMVDGVQASQPLEGAPYVWGGSNWGDCSGTASAFAAFAIGIDPFPRKFATASEEGWLRDNGFTMGSGPEGSFRVGWVNGGAGGGHTSVTLPDGTNAEMGGARGNGQLGGGAAGADHSQYTHRAWYPAAVGSSTSDDGQSLPSLADESAGEASGGATVGTSTSGGDQNLVPLTDEGAAAAETLDTADPGLLGGASTWSDFGGSVVAAAVSGHIADVLGVFGIPNELPPVVKAGQQWFQAAKEANQKTAEFVKAEADLIKAADAVTEAEATVDEGTVDGEVTAEVAEPVGGGWGHDFFVSEIARAARDMGLSKKAAEIGVATAMVESGDPLKMYANNSVPESLTYRYDAVGSDYDSVGLFQQRDNGAWGTVAQRMDPYESAKMFFAELMKIDWESMDPGAAAQAVQRSAFPGRYATKMESARAALASIPAFKNGGLVKGGRGKNLDDVLAWLSNGEMVINSGSVQADPDMAKTLNEQGPEAVKAQVLDEVMPDGVAVDGAKADKPVETFDVDPGSIQNTINNALPALMNSVSWADAAKLVTSSAVSFAGNAATDIVAGGVDSLFNAALQAPGMLADTAAGAAGAVPGVGALASVPGAAVGAAGELAGMVPISPGDLVSTVGGLATDAAAWYSGEVAWGTVNAVEQYSKDLFGTVLLPFTDVMNVLKTPMVGELAATAGINVPGAQSWDSLIPEPVRQATTAVGDTYNFIARNREGMYSDYRREMAKSGKGLIGAR